MRYCDTQQPTPCWGKHNDTSAHRPLVQYLKNGRLTNPKGKSYQRYCYISTNMQWACRECNMPLCHMARRGKEMACYNEHKESNDAYDGRGMIVRESFPAPRENLKVNKMQPAKSKSKSRSPLKSPLKSSSKSSSKSSLKPPSKLPAIRKRALQKELEESSSSSSSSEEESSEEEVVSAKRQRTTKQLDQSAGTINAPRRSQRDRKK